MIELYLYKSPHGIYSVVVALHGKLGSKVQETEVTHLDALYETLREYRVNYFQMEGEQPAIETKFISPVTIQNRKECKSCQ